MSDVTVQGVVPRPEGSATTADRIGRPAWFAAMTSRPLAVQRGGQRGLVTVEFIFGIILVIAIITVVVSVIHNPAIGHLMVQLVSWLLGLVKGVKP